MLKVANRERLPGKSYSDVSWAVKTWELMKTILAFLLGSAIIGFLIGLSHRVVVIAFTAPIIAVVAAIMVHDFHYLAAAVIVFVSLLVNQIAYLLGTWPRYRSTTEQFDDRYRADG